MEEKAVATRSVLEPDTLRHEEEYELPQAGWGREGQMGIGKEKLSVEAMTFTCTCINANITVDVLLLICKFM